MSLPFSLRPRPWPAQWHWSLLVLEPRAAALLLRWLARARPQAHAPVDAERLREARAQGNLWLWAHVLRWLGIAAAAIARLPKAAISRRLAPGVDSGLAPGLERTGRRIGAWMPSKAWRTAIGGLALSGLLVSIVIIVMLPASLQQQAVIGGGLFLSAMAAASVLRLREQDRIERPAAIGARLVLMTVALIVTGRYAYWRVTETLHFPHWTDAVAGSLLLAAEIYLWLVLPLGCLQVLLPMRRRRAPLPARRVEWPQVDVFIPTYNEPLSVVIPTVLAAQALDWPEGRLTVHLLDDGRREAFARFAAEAGVNYIARPDNRHAKAGNINHALARTQGEFVAIFDCDHIPTASFLTETMGWMTGHPDCALVQTPHHFFSRDPIERNLSMPTDVPNEGVLFYGLIQDGNDLWDASFFCGSCAVLRRRALEEVGGVAVETVTEDAHTALKMHRRGWRSVYVPRILAAGLATESLSGHIGQRMRWARGTAQILRTDNPLGGPGLSIWQRLCYLNAMLYFFNGLPRILLLAAPAAYLLLGIQLLDCAPPVLLSYLLPYLLVNKLMATSVHGRYRSASWGTVYESILAWFIAWPTLMALIDPKRGRFNVTAKGGRIDQDFFDWDVALPYLGMIAISAMAFVMGGVLIAQGRGGDPLTLALNTGWVGWNLLILGVTLHVASETRQVRREARVAVPSRRPARLAIAGGPPVTVTLEDFSLGGLGLSLDLQWPHAADGRPAAGARATVELDDGELWHGFEGRIVRNAGRGFGFEFDPLSLEGQRQLLMCTFARPGAWRHADDSRYRERPWQSQWRVLRMGFFGYLRFAQLGWRSGWRSFRGRRKAGTKTA